MSWRTKLKQKMGKEASVSYTPEFKEMFHSMKAKQEEYKRASKAGNGYLNGLSQFGLGWDALNVTWGAFARVETEDSLRVLLERFAGVQREMTALTNVHYKSVEENVTGPFLEFLDIDVVKTSELKKQYKQSALACDTAEGTVRDLESKKKADKLAKAQADLERLRETHQDIADRVEAAFDEIDTNRQVDLRKQVMSMIDAQYEYHLNALEICRRLKPWAENLRFEEEVDYERTTWDKDDRKAAIDKGIQEALDARGPPVCAMCAGMMDPESRASGGSPGAARAAVVARSSAAAGGQLRQSLEPASSGGGGGGRLRLSSSAPSGGPATPRGTRTQSGADDVPAASPPAPSPPSALGRTEPADELEGAASDDDDAPPPPPPADDVPPAPSLTGSTQRVLDGDGGDAVDQSIFQLEARVSIGTATKTIGRLEMAIKAGQEGGHDTGAWQAQLDELNMLRDVLNDAATTDSIRAETIVAIDKVVKQVAV